MAELTPNEPQYARDYDDRSTEAVRSVLVEIGQILGSFQGKFAVVGGAVPWLLLDNVEMPHVGTIDIDLGLDAAALQNGEYVHLVEALRTKGYDQSTLKKFQLVNDEGRGWKPHPGKHRLPHATRSANRKEQAADSGRLRRATRGWGRLGTAFQPTRGCPRCDARRRHEHG